MAKGLVITWQVETQGRALADLRIDAQLSARLTDEAMNHRQAGTAEKGSPLVCSKCLPEEAHHLLIEVLVKGGAVEAGGGRANRRRGGGQFG